MLYVHFRFHFQRLTKMGYENGGKRRPTKRRHVQGMLDETDPLKQVPHQYALLSMMNSVVLPRKIIDISELYRVSHKKLPNLNSNIF